MKVILQADVKGQGKKGQLVDVSDGYARNFLIPKKLALPATADNINTMQLQEKARRAKEAAERAEALELVGQLKDVLVKIPAKAGAGGKLFGSITTKEISDMLKKQYGYDIPKARLSTEPIKAFGTYEVKCKMGYEISGSFHVMVVEG